MIVAISNGSRYDDAIKYMTTLSRDALESEKNPGLAQQYDAKAQAILTGLHANAQTASVSSVRA